jgi:hypothetical protein
VPYLEVYTLSTILRCTELHCCTTRVDAANAMNTIPFSKRPSNMQGEYEYSSDFSVHQAVKPSRLALLLLLALALVLVRLALLVLLRLLIGDVVLGVL